MTQSSLENAISGHAQPLAEVVPGYSANTPTNEDTDQIPATLTPAQSGVATPNPGQASSSTNPSKKCTCLVCLELGIIDYRVRCRFVGCDWTSHFAAFKLESAKSWARSDRVRHEKAHYQQCRGTKGPPSPFYCLFENCRFNSKRWSDLQRHTTGKHCSDPVMFACSVLGCKHSGEGSGFTRKDKLKAHYESMHRGQRVPGQVSRALQPAPASSFAEASGSSSNSA